MKGPGAGCAWRVWSTEGSEARLMERRTGSGSGHDEATVVTTQLWLSEVGAPAGLGQRTCMGSSPGEGAMASGLGSRADKAAKIEGREHSGSGRAGAWASGRSGQLWARAEAMGVAAGAEAACRRERGLDHSGDCGLRGSGRGAAVSQGQEALGRGLGPLFPSLSCGLRPSSARLS